MQRDPRCIRIELNNEWHARPSRGPPPPFRCAHVVEPRPKPGIAVPREEFAAFCADARAPTSGPPLNAGG